MTKTSLTWWKLPALVTLNSLSRHGSEVKRSYIILLTLRSILRAVLHTGSYIQSNCKPPDLIDPDPVSATHTKMLCGDWGACICRMKLALNFIDLFCVTCVVLPLAMSATSIIFFLLVLPFLCKTWHTVGLTPEHILSFWTGFPWSDSSVLGS